MCEAVYHKCDTCKGEYMPSKTEQNDEHFRASLIIPPSVTSYCPPPLFYCYFHEAQITMNVTRVLELFSYSRIAVDVLQRKIQGPVHVLSVFRPSTLLQGVSLCALLCPRVVQWVSESAKVLGVTLDYYMNS